MGSEKWPVPPAELRRRQARALYEIEMLFREEGLSSFVYDEEKDLFCFPDGRLAFSLGLAWTSSSSRSAATRDRRLALRSGKEC